MWAIRLRSLMEIVKTNYEKFHPKKYKKWSSTIAFILANFVFLSCLLSDPIIRSIIILFSLTQTTVFRKTDTLGSHNDGLLQPHKSLALLYQRPSAVSI